MQTVYAAHEKGKIEVTAKHLESTKTTVKATEGVVVYYQDSVIKAESASYNKSTKILTLDGKVEMIGYRGTKEHTDHMKIHTGTKEIDFDQLFFVSQNDIWLFSDKAHRSESNYTLGQSVLSSCDINDPLWKMVFSHSHYDRDEKYMKVYDAKVYFWDIPIFYTPYMAFSTDNKRSSGLLFPMFGYTAEEGFVYEQPVFWAISPSMDLEFNPQIRTDRSLGLYSTFRFVDSDHSSGKLRAGYFRDSTDYQSRENTKDLNHYGLEFLYDSSRVFQAFLPKGFTDGLYVNTTFLTDIDYLNLQRTHLQHFGLTPLQESKLNYFLYDNDYYGGVNAKYFIDTRKEHNDDTVQILPSVQLHKYLDHFLWDNLTYSADLHVNHFYRERGATLKQAELKVPLEFTTSFFNDFLNISVGEEFYYSKFFFGNGSYEHDSFQYYSNIHKVKLFTDLTKKYDDFIHVLQPSVEYVRPGNENEQPVKFDNLGAEQKKLFAVGLPEEQYRIGFNQYFYTRGTQLKFFQRLYQTYYPNREYAWADLENEMQYNWKKWQFYNNLAYSYEFGKLRESSSRISLSESDYFFSLGHTYKKKLPDDASSFVPANDLLFGFGYTLNQRVKFNGGLTYSIDKKASTQWRFGGKYQQDCWSMDASVRQDITPRPTGSTKVNSFYIQLNFIPFGGVSTGDAK
ncbi:LPS-assembly protein LptD [Sulfurovum sp.]|uniref:LPS-assembly protein LptD n=1 Tax=Sulfurovum sp. TaxID=1969726 RepID=UPI0025E1C6A9|nr:LPS-assembly protein LptD [Sulfurovum sp.]